MFGSVNSETLKQLEFALNSVQSERGHKLEGVHNDPQLAKAETHIQEAIKLLQTYQKRTK